MNPSGRWAARLGVALLHLGLLALLWQHRPPPLATSAERRVTTVRLLPLPRTPAPADKGVDKPAPTPLRTRLPAPQVLPQSEAGDQTDAPAAPSTPTPSAPSPETAAALAPRMTLKLTLPPGAAASSSARSQALNDPRSNTRRQSFEDRIANAAAVTGDWVEERAGDGRMRRRRGDTCVETEESRIAMIDRFNENVAPRAAKMTGKPYKCPP